VAAVALLNTPCINKISAIESNITIPAAIKTFLRLLDRSSNACINLVKKANNRISSILLHHAFE